MKRRFKIMLAIEDEEGAKGMLTPLLSGYVEVEVEDPMADNSERLHVAAETMCKEVQESLSPGGALVAMDKLLKGESR